LTERDFKDRYKLDKARFAELCDDLSNDLETHTRNHSSLSVEVCVAATIHHLAGGHRHDISDIFDFRSGSTFYHIFDKTMVAIDNSLELPGLFGTPEEMKRRELEFAAMSNFKVQGCTGALDGLAIKIGKLLPQDAAAEPYKNRKCFYSLNIQAICDARQCFLWFCIKASGGQ